MKINLAGREVEAQEMDFETVSEQWSEYRIKDDGTSVEIRSIPVRMIKTDQTDPTTGEPLYLVTTSLLTRIRTKSG